MLYTVAKSIVTARSFTIQYALFVQQEFLLFKCVFSALCTTHMAIQSIVSIPSQIISSINKFLHTTVKCSLLSVGLVWLTPDTL